MQHTPAAGLTEPFATTGVIRLDPLLYRDPGGHGPGALALRGLRHRGQALAGRSVFSGEGDTSDDVGPAIGRASLAPTPAARLARRWVFRAV